MFGWETLQGYSCCGQNTGQRLFPAFGKEKLYLKA